jgi:uncharacterized protein YjgD (DUF1641 family)
MGMDILDDAYHDAVRLGLDVETLIRQGTTITPRLAALLESEEINALIDSGMLDPKVLEMLADAGNALVATHEEPWEKVGLFGMLNVISDPDIQSLLGFGISFAKRFAKTL